ncbi:MAG: Ig-like domain-containing protein [Pirellulaceae bacterium]|nr:Ig-like domain-containing protein [Pirellulaceae bacterium]
MKSALRRPVLELLEDRRLMAAVPYSDGKYYPLLGITAGDTSIPAAEYARRARSTNGIGGSNQSSADGLGSPVANTTIEVEPNNFPRNAQLLPLGTVPSKFQQVTVAGSLTNTPIGAAIPTFFDEDFYAVDLLAGDILDAQLTGTNIGFYDVSLNDANGNLLVTSIFPNASAVIGSPLSVGGTASFSYVTPNTGRYLVRVSDGTAGYSLRLQAFRNTFEQETVGTRQILFLDFDGATIRLDPFLGIPLSARIEPFDTSLSVLGILPTEANQVVDEVVATVRENFIESLPLLARNGYYTADGIPGHFDIDIRDSRTSPDPWGLPNVSRVIFGNNIFLAGLRGIAQSVDPGNFYREETALTTPEGYVDALLVPIASGTTRAKAFGRAIGNTASHEAGHFYGARHQNSFNTNLQLMDEGGQPTATSRMGVGPDGIFGTIDDIDIDFGVDEYSLLEGFSGIEDTAATMAFGLSTGMRGGFVSGTTFNDRNRNGLIGSGEEGLANQLVYADYNSNGVADVGEPRAVSGANGTYILVVAPGTWKIRGVPQTNWLLTGAAFQTVTVGLSQTVSNINFGQVLPNQAVTGFKWSDTNGNGIRDAGEPGMGGFWIYVDLDGDDRIDLGEPSAVTAADGSYSLNPPTTGFYAIREVVPPGFIQTFPIGGEHLVTFNGTPLRGIDFGNQSARDYGDAPGPYPTLISQNGPSHGFDANLFLGTNVDFDANGNPNANATGDDIVGRLDVNGLVIDDEDGVTFARPIVANDTQNLAKVLVRNATGSVAFLSGWIDFNRDGDWSDAGEKILSDISVTSGQVEHRFTAPSSALLGNTFARFRLSRTPALGVTGPADNGEVEDYLVNITNIEKYAIDDNYTVPRSSIDNVLNVQSNDYSPSVPGESARITGVTQGTAGGLVTSPDGQTIRYTPRTGFTGTETFTYTVLTSNGKIDSATVTVTSVFNRIDPVAVDDSYDIASNSVGIPLNVLANDLEGTTGALQIISVTTPNKGGTAIIGQGSLSIRYSPLAGFGGTETFNYTARDNAGKLTSATVTVHTLEGDRLDDKAAISLSFTDLRGNPISAIRQGDKFQLHVAVTDLRAPLDIPSPGNPGVFAAYLDLLYNSSLVSTLPGIVGGGFDFDVTFVNPYNQGRLGSAATPGIITQLGANTANSNGVTLTPPVRMATLTFNALSAGIADFISDPADPSPTTDVLLFSEDAAVPEERIRYRRASIEIVPNSVEFPFAIDDSLPSPLATNSSFNFIDVLRNDRTGNSPPVSIVAVTQPLNGFVSISDNGTPANPADDRVVYTPTANFQGTDQFTYTIRDTRGFQSAAKVTVQVGNATTDDIIQLRLEATNLSGQSIDQITVGQRFQLRGYVQQLRALNGGQLQGVYAAYQDILYDPRLAAISPISFDTIFGTATGGLGEYPNAPSGDLAIPGLINELGSTNREIPTIVNFPGTTEKLQFVIEVTALAAGVLNFVGDPADISPFHDSLVFDPTTVLLPSQIRYVNDSITIGSLPAGEGFTNARNPSDVNNDGFTSPIDALIVINSLARGGIRALSNGSGEGESASRMFIDVNGDGFISPIDALQVINAINRNSKSGSGEGESSVAASQSVEPSNSPLDLNSAIDLLADDIVNRNRRRV